MTVDEYLALLHEQAPEAEAIVMKDGWVYVKDGGAVYEVNPTYLHFHNLEDQ